MSGGSFDIDGRPFSFEIIEAEGFDGESWSGGDVEDHLHESDRIFYSVEAEWGEEETYYRWLGGPYESLADLESDIEIEVESGDTLPWG
jgi:hypothetical protein